MESFNGRMKILYTLSLLCGGLVKVWAEKETFAGISGTSMIHMLMESQNYIGTFI